MDGHDEQDKKKRMVADGPLGRCWLDVIDDALCRLAAMSDMAYSATIAEAHALVQGVLAGMLELEVLVAGVDYENDANIHMDARDAQDEQDGGKP